MLRNILSAASLGLAVAATPVKAADEINFGIIATEASSNLKKTWEPFLAEMGKKLGLKVNGFYASDYAGVIEAMRFNKVQLAWYGNKSAMEAVDRANGEIFVQSVDKDGNPGYWSHIIVHKDSPFQKLEDVLKCDKTLDFGIGDPNSTSGFLVPSTFVFSANALAGVPSTRYRGARPLPGLWMTLTGAAALLVATVHHPVVFWLGLPTWGFAFWMGIPGVYSLLAERSHYPEERAGDAQAIMAAGRVIGPLLGGALYAWSATALGVVGGGIMILAGLAMVYVEWRIPPDVLGDLVRP